MSDIAIITDSIACLPPEFVNQYRIQLIPITIMAGGHRYRDGIDITPNQAYQLFLQDPDSFKAAPATPAECLDVFRQAYQISPRILCVTVSLKISTIYNIARITAGQLKNESPDSYIELLDSETAAAAQGMIVLAASRAAEAGKALPEVLEAAKEVKGRVHSLVLLDTVRFVYRSGRVPRIAAQAASVLNIRPIFNISGSVNFVTAVHSRHIGIERMLKIMREKIDDRPIHCAVMHAFAPEEAQRLKEMVAAEFNCVELWISEFSPVMGYATGTNTLGLAFYTDS